MLVEEIEIEMRKGKKSATVHRGAKNNSIDVDGKEPQEYMRQEIM